MGIGKIIAEIELQFLEVRDKVVVIKNLSTAISYYVVLCIAGYRQ